MSTELSYYTVHMGDRVVRVRAANECQKKYIGRIGTVQEKDYGNVVQKTINVLYDKTQQQLEVLDVCCNPEEFIKC